MNEPERDYLGNIICHCAACDWCKSLEDSAGRTIYFCMNADSTAYLEETGLLGGCTFPPEYEMPEDGLKEKALTMVAAIVKAVPKDVI